VNKVASRLNGQNLRSSMTSQIYETHSKRWTVDPRTHFIVTEMGEISKGVKRAYLTWTSDSNDYYPKINELDLKQLEVVLVKASDGSLGHGWIYYKGQIKYKDY
jgi:hypothetical protein